MIKGGPKIINDGLVLCLDAHDAKSYAGEPTTNLSPNSDYSGASLDTINSGSNGGWGTTFDRWISEIEGPGDRTVKAFHLKLTGSTGSAPNAEGDASLVSGIASQAASLTSGNSYRVSAWAKVIRANGSSTAQTSSNLLYLTGAAAIGSSSLTVNTTWTRISASFSISTTGSYRLYHYFYGVSVGDILVITEPQIELKSYNTPYVYSSRSATNGWVDRTGNSTGGTLTNMDGTGTSHYRDGEVIMPVSASYLRFDGSDAEVIFSQNSAINLSANSPYTLEYWVSFNYLTSTDFAATIMKGSFSTSYGHLFIKNTNDANTRILVYTDDDSSPELTVDYPISTATWYHIVQTFSSGTAKLYVNGELEGSASGLTSTSNTSALRLGSHAGTGYFLNGDLAKVSIYNIALTDAQVLSNYNATKERF